MDTSYRLLLTMFVMWLVCVGFTTASKGEINVAPGSSCTASSVWLTSQTECEGAIHNTNGYYSNYEGVGLWFKIHLADTYNVLRLRILDLPSLIRKNKGLLLTFSDGSTQTVSFPAPEEGYHWTDFPITPVSTNSVLITVISVYTHGHNGFSEIEVLADVDECALKVDNCDVKAKCDNTPGSFNCACFPGFNGDGITCTDVDECALKTDNCDVKAKCENTPGSYTCTCFPFFKGDGFTCIANSCQVYRVAGTYATPEERRAAVLQDKTCLKKCANSEGCVASLQHMDSRTCTLYYRESDADKAQYGPGYIMCRVKIKKP